MSSDPRSAPHVIRIVHKGLEKTLEVSQDEFLVGSDESANIRIADSAISRKHALINISMGRVFVRDLGSTNGTYIDDVRIPPNEDIALTKEDEMFSLSKVVWISIITAPVEEQNSAVVETSEPRSGLINKRAEPPVGPRSERSGLIRRNDRSGSFSATGSPSLSDATPGTQSTELGYTEAPSSESESRTARSEAVSGRSGSFERPERSYRQLDKMENSTPEFRKTPISNATHEVLESLEVQISDLNTRHAALEADFRVRKLSLDSTINEMELQQSKAKTELDTLLSEQRRIISESHKTKTDTDQHVSELIAQMQALEIDKRSMQEKLDLDQSRVEQLRAETKDREAALVILRKDGDEARAQTIVVQEEQRKAEAIWKEARQRMELDLETFRSNTERETNETNERIHNLKTEAAKLDELIKNENEAFQKLLQTNQRETETLNHELSKKRAASEVEIAEARVKKLGMDASYGDAEAKLTDLKRQYNEVMVQKAATEEDSRQLRAEADHHHAGVMADIQGLKGEVQRIQDNIERLKGQTSEQEIAFARAKEEHELTRARAKTAREELAREESILMVFLERSKSERKKIEEEIGNSQKRIDGEMDVLRKEAEKKIFAETQAQRAELEKVQGEVKEVQKLKDQQVAQLRQEVKVQLQAETDKMRAEMKADAIQRRRVIDEELDKVRVQEMERIGRLREETEAAEKVKKHYVADDIVSTIMDFARRGSLEESQPDLKRSVVAILSGETKSSVSVQAAERTRNFWKRMAVFASGPTAVAIFFMIFPHTFDAVKRQFDRTVASEQKDSGVFLNEIQQKGVKYQPDMDNNYRSNYSDNILYLRNYVEMKMDQEYERKWTLILNDFIVGRLGLSDRIIPNFIANEAVMIKELMAIREGILPQFKEQGINRMNSAEQQALIKITDLLQTPENYQKFRNLEKEFYGQYLKEKGTAASADPNSAAGVKKP